jgi:hypothetical protein
VPEFSLKLEFDCHGERLLAQINVASTVLITVESKLDQADFLLSLLLRTIV